jgi:hypothetical protein
LASASPSAIVASGPSAWTGCAVATNAASAKAPIRIDLEDNTLAGAKAGCHAIEEQRADDRLDRLCCPSA